MDSEVIEDIQKIKAESRRLSERSRIIEEVVKEYRKTPEFDEFVKSLEIDQEELKKRVMDEMVKEIIKNWRGCGTDRF